MTEHNAGPERILITGYTGFLGGHLCARLHRELPGADLIGVSRRAPHRPGVRALASDLGEVLPLQTLLAKTRPDWIFHLAGGRATASPADLVREYLLPTATLLQAVENLPAPRPRLILAGSSGEYGLLDKLPAEESMPCNPITAYGAVKLAQTSLAAIHARRGLDVVNARIFNLLGPGLPTALSIGSFTRQVVEIERGVKEPVLETGSLEAKRDFVDVSDVTRALLLLARKGRSGQVYNVASGRSIPVAEAVSYLLSLSRKPIRLVTRADRLRKEDIPDMLGSYAKLRAETGWEPSVPVADSLSAMLEHERESLVHGAS